jgi:ATPase subunit of ABC transporter with duplicated ATPase domains
MKKHAQQTTSKLNKIHEERVSAVSDNLQNAKDKISPENRIVVDLRRTQIPNGKLVAEFKAVKFSYESKSLFNEFNLIIYGPERLAINGPNGSGKSTLVKLLLGELKPESGEITKWVEHSAYLDQHVAILDKTKTVLENLKLISGLDETMGRNWLARFLFSADDVFKKVEILSGGERVRAALACILAGDIPPKLLVLDEPTNNLDLNSIEQIESALLNFEGALVVISHDKSFLQNIGISKEINLSLW